MADGPHKLGLAAWEGIGSGGAIRLMEMFFHNIPALWNDSDDPDYDESAGWKAVPQPSRRRH